ncbi:MAG: hypothetical protein Q3997_04100 [Propionibacteriaceae bacterium]|nr:hypothetical protein [Propionibacteriaceae bacterium]
MTTFLVIGGLGIALLLVSLVLGDVLGDLDVDMPLLDSDLFSTASLAGFLGALGFAGAATLHLTEIMVLAIAVGIVAGLGFAWGAIKLSHFLKRGELSDAYTTHSLIGADALVITDIPAGGFGEIRLSVRGHVTKLNARALEDLPTGTEVWISGVVSPTAVEVSPTMPELAP